MVRTATAIGILLLTAHAHGALIHRARQPKVGQAAGTSLRKRLHVNDLIAEPGTVEVDFGGLYSYTTSRFTLPSALKFTPAGRSLFWGATEYSVAFDTIVSAVDAGGRATQFSDSLAFAATTVVYDSPHLDVAVAPQLIASLREEAGVRLGGTTIVRYDGGRSTTSATVGWTGAVSSSDANPAGVLDVGAAYGRQLGSSGVLKRITPHMNAVLEKATGFGRTVAVFGGVEYQLQERVAFDISGQRLGLSGPGPDRQLLLGLTFNIGK